MQRTSRASPGLCGLGRPCDRLLVESRFEAFHASGLTELVGREEELDFAASALVKGKDRRRSSGAALGRSGHREISADSGSVRMCRFRTTHAFALFLLCAAHGQRVLSHHQPDRTCRWVCARRHYASETRQTRCVACAKLDISSRRRPLCRMLSLPNDGRYPALELTPEQRRQEHSKRSVYKSWPWHATIQF